MSSCRQVPRHNRHNYTNLSQSCTVHVNVFKQLTTLWWCTSTLPLFHENSLKKIPIQNILQNFWNKCSHMRNNCKCLSSAQCLLITIINAKAPPILRIKVFWDVILCHWPSGFSHFEWLCSLQTLQKWTAMFGHRRLQKSIWLLQNDEKTQYHRTLSTPIKFSHDASGIRQFMYTGMSKTLCQSPGFWHNSVPSCSPWQTCTWMSPKTYVPGHNPNWMTTRLCVFTWDLDFGMNSSKSHQIHFQVIYYHLIFLLLCYVLS